MPYVNVPNDLSKIKTKIAFNLTKRQLICFGGAALVGVPVYLLSRSSIGSTGAMFLMLAVMLPAFMLAMYERYGYYKDDVTAITLKGIEGLAKIQEIMNTLRDQAPQEIGAYKVTAIRDYKKDTVTDLATGKVTPTGLPASNVLYYEMTDGACGTEPKVKFYLGVKGTSLADADQKSADLSKAVHAMIDKML